jgi:hypothetical protein
MGIISAKLRASAKGELCTFAIPGICNHNPETTVLCHIRDDAKDRRGNVEFAKNAWKEALPQRLDFVKACFETADKIVKNELQAPAARRYLEGLLK